MKIYIIAFALLLGFGSAYAQKTLTADDAIKIALNSNESILKANENLKSTAIGLRLADGALYPTVSASAGWQWSKTQFSAGYPAAGLPSATIDSRNYSASVNSDWIVFDGMANYSTIKKNTNQFESAKLLLSKLKQDVAFQTLSMFYDVLNAQKLVAVKEEDVNWNKKNFEIVQERNKLGAVTLSDVYSQQVKVGNAELELLKTKNSYETLKGGFLYYLGIDVLENYSLIEPKETAIENSTENTAVNDFEQISALVLSALKNRDDYQSAKIDIVSSGNDIEIAKAKYLPSIRNNAGFGTAAGSLSNIFKQREYSFGLSLSVPIFTGGALDNQVELAQIRTKISQLALDNLTRSIKREIQRNYLDLQSAYKRVLVSKENVKAAEESRRIQQEKYSLGASMLLDVLIANSEYSNAVISNINALYEYRKLKDESQYLLGKLDYKRFEN